MEKEHLSCCHPASNPELALTRLPLTAPHPLPGVRPVGLASLHLLGVGGDTFDEVIPAFSVRCIFLSAPPFLASVCGLVFSQPPIASVTQNPQLPSRGRGVRCGPASRSLPSPAIPYLLLLTSPRCSKFMAMEAI